MTRPQVAPQSSAKLATQNARSNVGDTDVVEVSDVVTTSKAFSYELSSTGAFVHLVSEYNDDAAKGGTICLSTEMMDRFEVDGTTLSDDMKMVAINRAIDAWTFNSLLPIQLGKGTNNLSTDITYWRPIRDSSRQNVTDNNSLWLARYFERLFVYYESYLIDDQATTPTDNNVSVTNDVRTMIEDQLFGHKVIYSLLVGERVTMRARRLDTTLPRAVLSRFLQRGNFIDVTYNSHSDVVMFKPSTDSAETVSVTEHARYKYVIQNEQEQLSAALSAHAHPLLGNASFWRWAADCDVEFADHQADVARAALARHTQAVRRARIYLSARLFAGTATFNDLTEDQRRAIELARNIEHTSVMRQRLTTHIRYTGCDEKGNAYDFQNLPEGLEFTVDGMSFSDDQLVRAQLLDQPQTGGFATRVLPEWTATREKAFKDFQWRNDPKGVDELDSWAKRITANTRYDKPIKPYRCYRSTTEDL